MVKKKKIALFIIAGVYAAVIAYSVLVVPVKATIGEQHPEIVYGYYPLWELYQALQSSPASSRDIPVTLQLNLLAWIIQLLFITLVFISLLVRTLRYFNQKLN